MLNSKIRPRAVVGYGVKIFHPSPPKKKINSGELSSFCWGKRCNIMSNKGVHTFCCFYSSLLHIFKNLIVENTELELVKFELIILIRVCNFENEMSRSEE